MPVFCARAPFDSSEHQASVIHRLSEGVRKNYRYQTFKGITGSGKTFTMAKIIEELQMPTLILSHNKTLAAQLYREFSEFFPDNAVEYFVSYYDYYQPEAYVPSRDLFIEKDSSINSEIERMRLSATMNLLERKDVIVVATVSCIYGIGNPETYSSHRLFIRQGSQVDGEVIKKRLIDLQYERNDTNLSPGTFRVRGEVMDIYSAYEKYVYRIEWEWDKVSSIKILHPITLHTVAQRQNLAVYPATHFVMEKKEMSRVLRNIGQEAEKQKKYFLDQNKVVEAKRIETRCRYDMDMLREVGYCTGIENYSRIIENRSEGERPRVLLDYFPDDFLIFIDESHVSLPQIRGMYNGDRARKKTLVEHGFRLPSALDNRPLRLEELEKLIYRCVFVSATPGPAETERSQQQVEQVIRPTGLLDPEVFIRSTEGQIEDLYSEIRYHIKRNERVLVTTLTKKMAEDLTEYLTSLSLRVRYLHSEIETVERVELLTDLRLGRYDVLVGINLLREGLDLPEVALVAILDADKVGFLRSTTSLIQIIGRAARNQNGRVLMYADRTSDAMQTAVEETQRRRILQKAYNEEKGISPQTIQKTVQSILVREKIEKKERARDTVSLVRQQYEEETVEGRKKLIIALENSMKEAAKRLAFEEAAVIRDEIEILRSS